MDLPMRALLLSRAGTVAWTADLDGDGSPEWVLESQKVRAVFTTADGGRLLDLAWKDTDTNFVPEAGAFTEPGTVEVHADGNALQFVSEGWTRTARLSGTELIVEQTPALPPDSVRPETIGNVSLSIHRESPSRAVYRLEASNASQ